MKLPFVGLAAMAAVTVGALSVRSRLARETEAKPDPAAPPRNEDVEKASRNFLKYVLVPVWMVPGFADYLCHRRSDIEHTSGTHESLTHMLMISSTGIGIATRLFFKVNELTIAIMAASALVHEAVVLWDVSYAQTRRTPSPVEQHMHSFLEVLPFTALAFTLCLHPDETAALLGRGKRPRQFRFETRDDPESPAYIAGVILLGMFALCIPYTEELVRCYRVDHTFLPHPKSG